MYGSLSFLPSTKTKPSRSDHVSPGRPTTRLTHLPRAPHLRIAAGGAANTTMSPRCTRRPARTTTWSSAAPRQPGFGLPQWIVGSIADEGLRKLVVPPHPPTRVAARAAATAIRTSGPRHSGLANHDFILAEPVTDQPVPGVRVANIGRQARRRQA